MFKLRTVEVIPILKDWSRPKKVEDWYLWEYHAGPQHPALSVTLSPTPTAVLTGSLTRSTAIFLRKHPGWTSFLITINSTVTFLFLPVHMSVLPTGLEAPRGHRQHCHLWDIPSASPRRVDSLNIGWLHDCGKIVVTSWEYNLFVTVECVSEGNCFALLYADACSLVRWNHGFCLWPCFPLGAKTAVSFWYVLPALLPELLFSWFFCTNYMFLPAWL